MASAARMLAVCDLLIEERGHLDVGAAVDAAARQLARLTRAEAGLVAIETSEGLVVGSYPDRVSGNVAREALDDMHSTGRISSTTFGGDVRAAAIVAPGFGSGIALAAGPVDGGFSILDEWLTSVVARRVEAQLAVVELHRERIAAAEVVRDASLAGELQRALMPSDHHQVGAADIAGRIRPARHAAGDIYDVLAAGDEAVAIIADVAGKGVSASLLTASVHAAAAHAVAQAGPEPAAVVTAMDREMRPLLERTGRIITLAVAATDGDAGVVRIASAGHHPVMVRSGSTVDLVAPGAPPLGIGSYPVTEMVMSAAQGDLVLLASDGIVDQRRPDGATFGSDRLGDLIGALEGSPAATTVDAIFADVADFAAGAPQDDDQTALVLRVGGAR